MAAATKPAGVVKRVSGSPVRKARPTIRMHVPTADMLAL